MEGSAPPKKDGISTGKELSSQFLVAIPSALSLEPQTPISLHATQVCSVLPLPEPRVSGCERHFVYYPFKRVPVSLADSCLPGLWKTH